MYLSRFRKRFCEGATVNISPMIDMVFILLIFFVVAAVFVDELGFASKTPDSVSYPPDADMVRLEVFLDKEGEVSIERKLIGETEIQVHVSRLIAANDGYAITVVIDALSNAGRLAEFLDALRLGGAEVVSLALDS